MLGSECRACGARKKDRRDRPAAQWASRQARRKAARGSTSCMPARHRDTCNVNEMRTGSYTSAQRGASDGQLPARGCHSGGLTSGQAMRLGGQGGYLLSTQ